MAKTSRGFSDPLDPVYPEIASSEAVTVVNGGGPSGENVLDLSPLSGGDYSTAGVILGGFGPIADASGDPNLKWWDATEGCISVSYQRTTQAWNQASPSVPVIIASSNLSGANGFALKAVVTDWNTGQSQGTFDFLYPVCGPTTWGTQELDTAPFTRAGTENQWQAFEVRWKNGTTDDTGSAFAADGWIRVSWNGTVIYDVENVVLCLNDAPQPSSGGRPNRLRTVSLGYAGLFGPATNLQVVDTRSPASPTNNPPPPAPASFGTISYYHTDAIGSVRMVSDPTQQVTRHDYFPFGQEYPLPQIPEFRLFGGKEHDQPTGFDYFGARYYSSGSGRFTTVDPSLNIPKSLARPQLWNRYVYTTNNALTFTDPDGRDPQLGTGFIGAGVYAAWNTYVNLHEGRPWYENIGFEAGKGFIVGATLGLVAPALTPSQLTFNTTTMAAEAAVLPAISRSTLEVALSSAADSGGR